MRLADMTGLKKSCAHVGVSVMNQRISGPHAGETSRPVMNRTSRNALKKEGKMQEDIIQLKTLKDIGSLKLTNGKVIARRRLIETSSLREEAIKWIKHLDGTERFTTSYDLVIVKWIKYFFNIEEDLKQKGL